MNVNIKQFVSTCSWVSIFALSWMLILNRVQVEFKSVAFFMFFLIVAFFSTMPVPRS
jgi:hypothetical protein